MHGISSLIVTILIMLIVISIVGISYIFFQDIFTTTTTTGEQVINRTTGGLGTQAIIESVSGNQIYLRNIGQTALSNLVVYVNDEIVDAVSPSVIESGDIGTITIIDFVNTGDEIKITTAQGIVSSKTAPDPCKTAVLCLSFDEGLGNVTKDSAGQTGNDGFFSGTTIADFESTLDGFVLECPGAGPTFSFVEGKIKKALKFWGTAGTGQVCASKSIGSLPSGYTVSFFAKGKVGGGFSDASGWASYIEDVETGCRTTIPSPTFIYFVCNGGNPYTNWKLFRIVAYRSSPDAKLYIFHDGPAGEASAGHFDFITNGPTWVKGKYGNALSFDGVDDYVNSTFSLPTTAFTISLWINPVSYTHLTLPTTPYV